jgi:cell division control protein 45
MFSIVPVFSKKNIGQELEKIRCEAKELKSLIFLNCGGDIDLTSSSLYKESEDHDFYVIDSHRPLNHQNINGDRIFVMQDQCQSFDECPTKSDDEELQKLGHIEDDDDDGSYDSEQDEEKPKLEDLDDEEDEAAPKKKKRNDDEIDLEEDNEIEELNREVEGQPRLGEKRPASQELVDVRKIKR